MRKLQMAAAVVAALGVIACGSGTDVRDAPVEQDAEPQETADQEEGADDPSDEPVAGPGDTVELSDGTVRIAVTLTEVVDPAEPGSRFDAPDGGRKLVAVQLTWENTGDSPYDYAPWISTDVIDGDGQRFSPELVVDDTSAGVNASTGTIAPGDTERGFVVFAVPHEATVARVQYSPSLFSDELAQWVVDG